MRPHHRVQPEDLEHGGAAQACEAYGHRRKARRAVATARSSVRANPTRRLQKELTNISKESLDWCSVAVVNDDVMNWRASIQGPPDSPYEGGVFEVDFVFPATYPFK